MEDKVSVDQYGRKTWDVKQYAQQAKKNIHHKKPEQSPPEYDINEEKSSSHMAHRQKLLDGLINAVKKHTLINPHETRKHKRFGFVCPVCENTYRDNMALIDHFNSPQHLQKVTKSALANKSGDAHEEEEEMLEGGIRHATVSEVETTLKLLLEQHMNKADTKQTLQQRIEARKQLETKIRLKKQKKRQKKSTEPQGDEEIQKAMGFSSFT